MDGKVPGSATRPKVPGSGGSRKGRPNLVSADLRNMVIGALSAEGGVTYLQRQANESPAAFLSLLGKCLPKEITGADGKDLLPSKIVIELVGAK